MAYSMLNNVQITHVLAPVTAASNTDSNTSIMDMSGYDGIMFIVPITDCTSGAVVTVTGQQNTTSSDSGMAALSGATAVGTSTAGDDLNSHILVLDIYKPLERYVGAAITTGTQNAAIGDVIAIQYQGRKCPISQNTSVEASTLVVSPAEA